MIIRVKIPTQVSHLSKTFLKLYQRVHSEHILYHTPIMAHWSGICGIWFSGMELGNGYLQSPGRGRYRTLYGAKNA